MSGAKGRFTMRNFNALAFTLRDFSLRENHLAGYPSFLTEEHNKRYAVRSVALTHPKIASQSFAYLNIIRNKVGG